MLAVLRISERCSSRLRRWQWLVRGHQFENNGDSQTSPVEKEAETDLAKHLKTKIKMGGGALSIAQFMREALTNPMFGFYMNRDVFGGSGDFVTSPEVSQVFGELLGIWCVLTWKQIGEPKRFRIIELGPGRGTLISDLLRGTQNISSFTSALESVHLVEISQAMRAKQAETLHCEGDLKDIKDGTSIPSNISKARITWHSAIEEVSVNCPELILGHEFLDALPIHQFVRTRFGWRERMVDIAEEKDRLHLRFVRAPSITPASILLPGKRLAWMTQAELDNVQDLEVGSDMISLGARLAQRIADSGGAALFIDYGKNGPYSWSIQGVRQHQRVHVLECPGKTDVSAYVDFAALRGSVAEVQCNAVAHGPIEQRYFLKALGIDERMNQLAQNATDAEIQDLKSGYERLIGSEETGQSDGMGKLYKAMVITRKDITTPVGFNHAPLAD